MSTTLPLSFPARPRSAGIPSYRGRNGAEKDFGYIIDRYLIFKPSRSQEPLGFDTAHPFTVLVTAPHDAVEKGERNMLRDPWSGEVARRLSSELQKRGKEVELIVATKHRRHFDQNRLKGLRKARDMIVHLDRFLVTRMEGSRGTVGPLSGVVHLDIHTYDVERPMKGWGCGINCIVNHADPVQRRFAEELCSSLSSPAMPRPKLVVMDRRADHEEDDDSNAVMDCTRAFGALSVLLELPVCTHSLTYDDSGHSLSYLSGGADDYARLLCSALLQSTPNGARG